MTAVRAELVAGTWTADPMATSAQFRARDILGRTVVGTLTLLSASVAVSTDGVPMHVQAELDLASVTTGNAKRDRDLRGPRFFDAQHDPVLRVTAGAARLDGPGRWLVASELTMKGHSFPLDILAELADLTDGQAHLHATATLDRREAGITVPRLLVGPSVAVVINAVLRAPKA